jgi:hypothetical protein
VPAKNRVSGVGLYNAGSAAAFHAGSLSGQQEWTLPAFAAHTERSACIRVIHALSRTGDALAGGDSGGAVPYQFPRRTFRLSATRTKRWSGDIAALPADYMNNVLEKMAAYGERVQFSLVSGGAEPSYQIINDMGKAIAFDRDHHLLQAQEDLFAAANATAVLTLEQINAARSGYGASSRTASKTGRAVKSASGPTKTAAARLDEQVAAARYAYFKEHRASLPPRIAEYSGEIDQLLKKGRPVEEAFGEVVKKYF